MPPKTAQSVTIAEQLETERKNIHRHLRDGETLYMWMYYHEGWKRWASPIYRDEKGQPLPRGWITTEPGWQLVRVQTTENDPTGKMTLQWSELVDPAIEKRLGRLDVVPEDIRDAETRLSNLKLLAEHEPNRHEMYYTETWEQFQKHLYCWAQNPQEVNQTTATLRNLVEPCTDEPKREVEKAVKISKVKLNLPALDLSVIFHTTHVHPKQITQFLKMKTVNMREVGRYALEAAIVVLAMDDEGALPALGDPMHLQQGDQVMCGCLYPKDTHRERVEVCKRAQVTGLRGAPYGNSVNLYAVKKDSKQKEVKDDE